MIKNKKNEYVGSYEVIMIDRLNESETIEDVSSRERYGVSRFYKLTELECICWKSCTEVIKEQSKSKGTDKMMWTIGVKN